MVAIEVDTPRYDEARIATLQRPHRIWAVGAVRGERERLLALHAAIAPRFAAGDRLVYLGDMLGPGADPAGTVDELLRFRIAVLAVRGMDAPDVVFLRGAQEEMWQKLLQLHFALEPARVLDWMLEHGLGTTLAAYGGDADDGYRAARGGATALARWTAGLRAAHAARPGHGNWLSALRCAAVAGSDPAAAPELLLVNAGLDPARPLAAQRDSFWWQPGGFDRIEAPWQGFARIVRGATRRHDGIVTGPVTLSLDAGCGAGGALAAALLSPAGDVLETFEA
ncbi:MAG: hypothetical protein AB7N54_13365 [Alphaproteobacteria bacterium]